MSIDTSPAARRAERGCVMPVRRISRTLSDRLARQSQLGFRLSCTAAVLGRDRPRLANRCDPSAIARHRRSTLGRVRCPTTDEHPKRRAPRAFLLPVRHRGDRNHRPRHAGACNWAPGRTCDITARLGYEKPENNRPSLAKNHEEQSGLPEADISSSTVMRSCSEACPPAGNERSAPRTMPFVANRMASIHEWPFL